MIAADGFLDPYKDPTEDDFKIWVPSPMNPPEDMDREQAEFILTEIGSQFCQLLSQEIAVRIEYLKRASTEDAKFIAWKRVIHGVREMCDVCETTLFNYHWTCARCGFVVCIDCYKARKKGEIKIWSAGGRDRDDFYWFKCGNFQHEPDELILTQIIAGCSFEKLGDQIHGVRMQHGMKMNCYCNMAGWMMHVPSAALNFSYPNRAIMAKEMAKQAKIKRKAAAALVAVKPKLAEFQLFDFEIKSDDSSSEDDDNDFHGFLGSTESKKNPLTPTKIDANTIGDTAQIATTSVAINTPSACSSVSPTSPSADTTVSSTNKFSAPPPNSMDRLFREEDLNRRPRRIYRPIRIMTRTFSTGMYPGVPHSWLCEGKLLQLHNPMLEGNIAPFQEQWKRGQPIIVSQVSTHLNMDLWRPEAFSRDFGEDANDLVNCMTGTLVPNQPMKRFWDGFDYVQKRIKDEKGNPMLLKLKDWPPGEDFAEILPTRFNDLMRCLPLGDYTKRDGKYNLASRLPSIFVKPDLGPKMYNAYGSALHPTKGTTNLHLDISDAVNVMVYVGIPKDTGGDKSHIREAFRAIDEADCDIITRRRVRVDHELPGALWHIYAPRDANKIRDLLNKVTIERGERLEPNHDPIHDQSWYLDQKLRRRLYMEYGVEGYPIVQCLGDAVFIPAGAPHQVRNLHNCIKVAEDFVSPENVAECFHLTHEFRALSDTHANHEDKLQIKNIIYHAVKDAVAVLDELYRIDMKRK